MNSVVLIGRLTNKPDFAYTPTTQTAVAKFTLAVDRPRRQGEESAADFIRVTVFGRQAETCDRYLDKGRQAAVLGRIQTGSYKNRDGVTVYTTDVIAERVEFLGTGNNTTSAPKPAQNGNKSVLDGYSDGYVNPNPLGMNFDDLPDTFQAAEDDIPF